MRGSTRLAAVAAWTKILSSGVEAARSAIVAAFAAEGRSKEVGLQVRNCVCGAGGATRARASNTSKHNLLVYAEGNKRYRELSKVM